MYANTTFGPTPVASTSSAGTMSGYIPADHQHAGLVNAALGTSTTAVGSVRFTTSGQIASASSTAAGLSTFSITMETNISTVAAWQLSPAIVGNGEMATLQDAGVNTFSGTVKLGATRMWVLPFYIPHKLIASKVQSFVYSWTGGQSQFPSPPSGTQAYFCGVYSVDTVNSSFVRIASASIQMTTPSVSSTFISNIKTTSFNIPSMTLVPTNTYAFVFYSSGSIGGQAAGFALMPGMFVASNKLVSLDPAAWGVSSSASVDYTFRSPRGFVTSSASWTTLPASIPFASVTGSVQGYPMIKLGT